MPSRFAGSGLPPSVAEFEWWRERELRLAEATGEDLNLPSSSPYRRRWGTWEEALLAFGFTADEVALRLEGKTKPHNHNADPYLPEGLPVAVLMAPGATNAAAASNLPLSLSEATRLHAAYGELPRRSRYVLTFWLGLGVPTMTLATAAAPLALSLDPIRQLQLAALDSLAETVTAGRPVTQQLRRDVTETLVTASSSGHD